MCPSDARIRDAAEVAESDRRDLARGAGVNYLGFVARLGARIPFLFLAGLLYGEVRFGEFTFGITVVETVAAVALFGLKRSLFKFMSEAEEAGGRPHQAIADGLAVAVMTGGAATLLVGLGADRLATLFRFPTAADALRLLSLAIPLIVLSDVLLTATRFTRRMRYEVWARSVGEPITLVAVITVAWLAGFREAGLQLGYVASLGVAAVLSAAFFVRLFPVWECLTAPLRWREIRRLAAFSGPTAGYDLLTLVVDKVDIFLVTFYSPPAVVGVYGMARQFATVTKKIRHGFDRILPPVLAQAVAAGDIGRARGQLVTVSRWILTVQVLIVLGFVFYGDEVLGLLGGQFGGAALILVLLMAGDAINGSLGVAELTIVYLKPWANVAIGAVMLAVGVAANVWLIRAWGAEGAAAAVLLTYAVANALRVGANRWLLGIHTVAARLLKPLAAAVPAVAVLLAVERLTAGLPPADVLLGIPLLVTTYVGALRLLGIEEEDRRLLARLLGR